MREKSFTDGDVFDRLHEWYGIGGDPGGKPWFKFRAAEVAQVRRVREKRGVALEDLLLTTEYVIAQRITVRHHMDLYVHVMDARKWGKERDYRLSVEGFEKAYAQAISEEMQVPDSKWLGRLLRAQGDYRRELFQDWSKGEE